MGKTVKCPDGGPAYPHTNWVENPTNGKRIVKGVHPGLSKLEVFAKAFVSKADHATINGEYTKTPKEVARWCFDMAEAMLAESERRRE